MPAIRIGSCNASPVGGTTGGVAAQLANRVRSASPSRRALASDMRRIAGLLREPVLGTGEGSVNTSICSSPHNAWEPGDRGAAPMGAGNTAMKAAIDSRLNSLTEKLFGVVNNVQRQGDADRRRLAQLERKIETRLEENNRANEGREKWAEIQGSVHGLLDETQALNRRIEDLDQRLWSRTSGADVAKQRNKDLEQQVQALEKSRLVCSALEETQKRQATKIRRSEHTLEELTRRITKSEEEMRARHGHGAVSSSSIEQRLLSLEQLSEQLNIDMHQLQEQLDEGFQAMSEQQLIDGGASGEAADNLLQEAVQTTEKGMANLEKKLCAQIAELASSLASLRVKSEGHQHRVASLAERLETSHEPALESLRTELSQARAQDRREIEGELMVLRSRVQEANDGNDDAQGEVREALRQAHAEIAALTLRPDENLGLRALEDRFGRYEREVMDLRARLDNIPSGEEVLEVRAMEEELPEDLEDMRRRIEWLEEQSTVGAVSEKADQRQVEQVQGTVCEMLEQVSNIKQRQLSIEASSAANQQQLQNLQGRLEQRSSDDSSSVRALSEFEAKVGAVSQQVVFLEARLMEVESGLEVARENEAFPGMEASTVSVASDGASNQSGKGLPPLPRGEVDRNNGQQVLGLHQQLEAVAEQLEAMDELSERVTALEQGSFDNGAIPSGDRAPERAALSTSEESLKAEVDNLAQKVSDVQDLRFSVHSLEQKSGDMKTLVDSVAKRVNELESSSQADGGSSDTKEWESRLRELSARIDAESAKHCKLETNFKDVFAKHEVLSDSISELKLNVTKENDDSGLAEQVEEIRRSLSDCEQKAGERSLRLDSIAKQVEVFNAKHEESTATLESITTQMDDLQNDVTALGNDKFTEKLAKVSDDFNEKVKALEDRVASRVSGASQAATATAGLSEDQVKEQVSELREAIETQRTAASRHHERHEKELNDVKVSHAEELRVLRDSLKKVQDDIRCLDDYEELDIKNIAAKIENSEMKYSVMEVTVDKLGELPAALNTVEELAKRIDTEVKQLKDEPVKALNQRVKALEDRLDSRPPPSPSHSPSASGATTDDRARAQVQSMVDELKTQVLEELGSLSAHQSELANAKVSLETLAKKVGSANDKDGSEFRNLSSRVDQVVFDIKKLQDNSSTSADNQDLRELRKQLAELQAKMREQPSPASGSVHRVGISSAMMDDVVSSPVALLKNKFDTLSEQVANLQSQVNSKDSVPRKASDNSVLKDSSLNFSLTEDQTIDSRIGGGSLNFSLTEQDDDALAKIMCEGGRPRPPALSLEESQTLASVAEEQSGELADESVSKSGNISGGGSVGLAGQTQKKTEVTPKSAKSSTGSPSREGILEISQSANDVSIGFDISVEDSLQLEDECDHVENVKINPKMLQMQGNRSATSPDDAAGGKKLDDTSSDDEDEDGDDTKVDRKRLDAPMTRDNLINAISVNKASVTTSANIVTTAVQGRSAPSSQPPGKDNVDEYEDSFDDDISVPESIESNEGSASD